MPVGYSLGPPRDGVGGGEILRQGGKIPSNELNVNLKLVDIIPSEEGKHENVVHESSDKEKKSSRDGSSHGRIETSSTPSIALSICFYASGLFRFTALYALWVTVPRGSTWQYYSSVRAT